MAAIELASSERQIQLQATVQSVRKVLRSHRLPSTLLSRVSEYFAYRKRSLGDGATFEVMEQLPEGIVSDVMSFIVGGLLERVPFLADCTADEGFLNTLATRMVR